MTAAVATLKETDLGDLTQIGAGGMAKVFAIPDFFLPECPGRRLVYKKLRPKVRPVPLYGLAALTRVLSELETDHRAAVERSFNWPLRVVVDDGDGAAGVVLPLIPDEYFLDLHLTSGSIRRRPAEAQYLFCDSGYCSTMRIPFLDEHARRALCRSLSYALGLLDRADVVYGDLSALNIIFRLTPRPAVMLVDCDAIRLTGGAAALGRQPHSPDWEPPEALRAKRLRDNTEYCIQNKPTDRYKLGLAILRILTPGPGCSTNLDPTVARHILPPKLYELLERSLSDNADDRPSARAWYEELTR
jgi:serine/threonine protein kinase